MSSLSSLHTTLEEHELVVSTDIKSKSLHISFDKYVTIEDARTVLQDAINSSTGPDKDTVIKLTPVRNVNSNDRDGGIRATIRVK